MWLALTMLQAVDLPLLARDPAEQRVLWERGEAHTKAGIDRRDAEVGLSPPPKKGDGVAIRSIRFSSGGFGPPLPSVELLRVASGRVEVRVVDRGDELARGSVPRSAWDKLTRTEAGLLSVSAYKPWNGKHAAPAPLDTGLAHCERLEVRAFDDDVEWRGGGRFCPFDAPAEILAYAEAMLRLAMLARPDCPTTYAGDRMSGTFGEARAAFAACYVRMLERWPGVGWVIIDRAKGHVIALSMREDRARKPD